MDWVAIRCLEEEFPGEHREHAERTIAGLERGEEARAAECKRRELPYVGPLDRAQPLGSWVAQRADPIQHELKAFREHRRRWPGVWPSAPAVAELPWRVAWREEFRREHSGLPLG